ncbi:hypothetical protein SAMN04488072_109101 [Lentibacillus halodurans]|uniref:Uncharacterized protein n=1 Tax=Lentibacillus halodurans TaxID=237679 RepID=A0A1I0Z5K8_9BACI|nr:hypothetical protein [Lentibacillus halodurans]SFB19543.1 hypothetical protein SAMN04488072_109101 [Lentibacillus halodurans]
MKTFHAKDEHYRAGSAAFYFERVTIVERKAHTEQYSLNLLSP